jgi:FG-GAP repeat
VHLGGAVRTVFPVGLNAGGSWRRWAAVGVRCAVLVVVLVVAVSALRLESAQRMVSGAAAVDRPRSLPEQAQSVISDTLGSASPAFAARRFGDVYRLAGGGVTGVLGGRGVAFRARAGSVSMALSAVGRRSRLRAVAPASVVAHANRVTLRRAGSREWYAGGPLGIEQGFTVARRPGGTGALTLALALGGSLRAQLVGSQVRFLTSAGHVALRYGGLVVVDSAGRTLPAWLMLDGRSLLVRVDDVGARYPLRIDPFVQQGPVLSPGGPTPGPDFGTSVTLSADGNTALISGSGINAWVFTRSGSTWTRGPELIPNDPNGSSVSSVALSADGNTALLGATGYTNVPGAAWVFTRSGSSWTQQGPALVPDNGFVSSVALSADGNTALLGWSGDNQGPNPVAPWGVGAAWVFTRSGSTWTQQGGKLTANDEIGQGAFGTSVALSADGNTALIGGPIDNPAPGFFPPGIGAAWVFTRSGSNWTQQGGKLTANDEIGLGDFGTGVALSGDGNTAVVGGPLDNGLVGGAWVFTRSGSSWTQQGSRLAASGGPFSGEPDGFDRFGNSVALSADGGTALIAGTGPAWVFTRSGQTWAQQAGPRLEGTWGFGGVFASAALSGDGDTALFSGTMATGTRSHPGAAWVFVPTTSDQFGDWFALYSTDLQLARCNSGQAIASLTVPYSRNQPPHYTNGLLWADYFGIPFAISPPLTLPDRGLSSLGGETSLPIAAAGLPIGQYNIHFLLWNASGQSGTLSGTTNYFPLLNPDCSFGIPFLAARDDSVSRSTRAALARSKPPYRTIIARVRAAQRRALSAGEKPFAHLIRVPHAMISPTNGHLRAPSQVLRRIARLRARVASLRRGTPPFRSPRAKSRQAQRRP